MERFTENAFGGKRVRLPYARQPLRGGMRLQRRAMLSHDSASDALDSVPGADARRNLSSCDNRHAELERFAESNDGEKERARRSGEKVTSKAGE